MSFITAKHPFKSINFKKLTINVMLKIPLDISHIP